MSNSLPSILQTWLHPLALTEFLDRHWTRQPYWTRIDPARLKFTEELLPDVDLINLLDYAVHPIKAWYLDDNKPVYSLALGRKEAFHAYRAGLTLYFHLDASVSAGLISQLSRELSRAPALFKVSIFATRRGGRTAPHVDGNENFTVQLKGTKRWKISAGEIWPGLPSSQENPNHSLNELFRILREPESWSDVQPLELSSGAVLYCPAKFWHTVETIEDSLSLNVSIETTYTWADALLPAIRTALLRNRDWASCEVGLWASGDQAKQAERSVSELLQRLNEDLRDIKSADVIAAWIAADEQPLLEAIPSTFVRNPFVSCGIVATNVESDFHVRIESSVRPGKIHALIFPWKSYSSFLDLVSTVQTRHSREFADAQELVSELLRYGVLRPGDTDEEREYGRNERSSSSDQ